MTKLDSLRRLLLPCLGAARTSPSPPPAAAKKRLSTSLRDDDKFPPKLSSSSFSSGPPKQPPQPQEPPSCCSSPSTPAHHPAPPRPSRTMVIGTIFGHRRGGHVWFCVQQDRLTIKPTLLLELSIPTSTLIQEMHCGLVRIALEFNAAESDSSDDLSRCPLRAVPLWTLFCNGRKLGFAVRRKLTPQSKAMLKTMQNVSVGAGVLPCGSEEKEIMYMRANYECVLGSADSESFHLINPDQGPGQELSVFLLRTR